MVAQLPVQMRGKTDVGFIVVTNVVNRAVTIYICRVAVLAALLVYPPFTDLFCLASSFGTAPKKKPGTFFKGMAIIYTHAHTQAVVSNGLSH